MEKEWLEFRINYCHLCTFSLCVFGVEAMCAHRREIKKYSYPTLTQLILKSYKFLPYGEIETTLPEKTETQADLEKVDDRYRYQIAREIHNATERTI